MYAMIRKRFGPYVFYVPLVAYVLPTLIIGFGFVIPGSPIEGVNAYTIGFLSAVVGFALAYVAGISIARREGKES